MDKYISVAARLQLLRTLDSVEPGSRAAILDETMSEYIPLAHKLGLYTIKSEMEDIWFKYSEPEAYRQITDLIAESLSKNSDSVSSFVAPIEGMLRRGDFTFRVKTRVKSPYSVWRKMTHKKIPFDEIYDLYAVRIIYESASDDPETERMEAYRIFSEITSLYKEIPSRHRDWILSPKSNGYEALHGTFKSLAGIWIEVQIRSERMDDIAENGIASHWSYKQPAPKTEEK